MRGAQLAVTFDIPFLEQVSQSRIVEDNAFALGDAAEYFPIFLEVGISDFDFVP